MSDASRPLLVIGNKNYSSWSMRPWLALRWAGIGFDERVIELGPRYGRLNPEIAAVSPTGRVPVLILPGGLSVWDSLAICEWAAETAPEAQLWPRDSDARALARAASAEMHSGFAALRRDLPMNVRRRTTPGAWGPSTWADIARADAVLSQMRARAGGAGGGFLTGPRPGIADAMYAPVATRLRTYGAPVSPSVAGWMEALFADPHVRDWEAAAAAEPWTIAETDAV